MKSGNLNFLETSGHLGPVTGLIYLNLVEFLPNSKESLVHFIDIKSFRLHYGPEVDSASKTDEYQEHFLGVKAAGA